MSKYESQNRNVKIGMCIDMFTLYGDRLLLVVLDWPQVVLAKVVLAEVVLA